MPPTDSNSFELLCEDDLGVRSGLYPPSSFPHTVGVEAAGVVVALPTSETVLEDPAYKKRNIKIGDKVVTVSAQSHI